MEAYEEVKGKMDELSDEIQARMADMAQLPKDLANMDIQKLMKEVTGIAERQAQEHVVFCMEEIKKVEDKTNGRMNDIDTTLRRVHDFATGARDDMLAMRKDILTKMELSGARRQEERRPDQNTGYVTEIRYPPTAIKYVKAGPEAEKAKEAMEQKLRDTQCYRCGNNGHNADECREAVKCEICGYTNHRTVNCRRKRATGYKRQAAEEPVTCRNCGQNGHISKECKKPHATQCGNCSMKGHKKEQCTNEAYCPICQKAGHAMWQCQSGQRATIFCYNCMRYGHSRSQCKVGAGFCGEAGEEHNRAGARKDTVRAGGGDAHAGTNPIPSTDTRSTNGMERQGHQGHNGGAESMLNGEGAPPPPDPDADEAPGPENKREPQLIKETDKGAMKIWITNATSISGKTARSRAMKEYLRQAIDKGKPQVVIVCETNHFYKKDSDGPYKIYQTDPAADQGVQVWIHEDLRPEKLWTEAKNVVAVRLAGASTTIMGIYCPYRMNIQMITRNINQITQNNDNWIIAGDVEQFEKIIGPKTATKWLKPPKSRKKEGRNRHGGDRSHNDVIRTQKTGRDEDGVAHGGPLHHRNKHQTKMARSQVPQDEVKNEDREIHDTASRTNSTNMAGKTPGGSSPDGQGGPKAQSENVRKRHHRRRPETGQHREMGHTNKNETACK